MNALNYLNEITVKKSAFVPDSMTLAIIKAAALLGVAICGGLYDPETKQRVLYLA